MVLSLSHRRVACARALANDPAILLADEPTANIYQDTASNVMELFISIRSKGRTLIVVSHDPDMAARADRVIRMDKGRLLA